MTADQPILQLCRDGTYSRHAALAAPLRQLHQSVLRFFVHNGRPPGSDDLRRMAAGLDLRAVLRQLAEADLVHTGPTGEVTVAYPFSGSPTGHTVELDGTPPVQSCCAIDALGIPQMTGRDGVITSADPVDRAPVRVELRDGTWLWRPAGTVVLVGSTGSAGPSVQCACPLMTFHTSRAHAEQYLRARAGQGVVLGKGDAIAMAFELFGRLMD